MQHDHILNTGRNFRVDIVLLEPEIPQNTGNIARTCAALGCKLHLIEPLGFSLEDKYLKRAGLDYWTLLEVDVHKNIDTFLNANPGGVLFFFSKKADRAYHEAAFAGQCFLVFGKETLGLPDSLLETYRDACYRIPMREGARSLNLANSVAITAYEAFRQNGFPGLLERNGRE